MSPTDLAERIIREALALRASHPHVPALEVFDVVMEGRRGSEVELPDMEVTPPGPRFAALLVDAFMPYSQEELRILAGDIDSDVDDFHEADEMRPGFAAQRFFLRYELNGYQQREAWAQSFADATVARHPSTVHADAYVLGLRLWPDNWNIEASSVAYWRGRRISEGKQ
jgi:hypothetical protein